MNHISIEGMDGVGKSTTCKLLAERLGYKMINFTFRQLAAERGVEFWDFCRMAENDDNIDRELDRRQVEMAMAESNCVLGSRLAIWMLDKADLKVYLRASSLTREKRVLNREGGDLELRINQTEGRDAKDSARYMRIYGIDNSDTSIADLVIDTDDKTPQEIVDIIVKKLDTLR